MLLSQHEAPAALFSPAPLLHLLRGCLDVEFAFLLGLRDGIVTLKRFGDIAAALTRKTGKIDGAIALLIDLDRDRFLFHDILASTHREPQLHLLAVRSIDHLPASEHVAFGLR
jgi:hypothetical protein